MQRYAPWLNGFGMLFSALVAVFAGVNAFIHPFNHSSADLLWAVVYLMVLLAIGAITWLNHPVLLFRSTICLSILFLLAVVIFSDNGPALLGLVWILVLAAAVGNTIIHWLGGEKNQPTLERVFLDIALGLGLLSLIIFAMGCGTFLKEFIPLNERYFRWLHPVTAYGVMILLTILFVPGYIKRSTSLVTGVMKKFRESWQGKPGTTFGTITLVLLAICAFGPFVWSLAPTIRFDSVVYHLSVPATYIQNRGMIDIPEPIQSYWAHNTEMLFTLGLLLTGQPLPGLIHFSAGILSTAFTYLIGKRIGGSRLGLIACVVFYSLPILFESGTPFNDFFTTLYVTAAIYSMIAWWQDEKDVWLSITGVMIGLAIGTKLSALVVLAPAGLFLLMAIIKRSRFSSRCLVNILQIGLPALILFIPWALRDWYWTGNPVIPFFNDLFRSPGWPETNTAFIPRDSSMLLRLIKFPWSITVDSQAFYPKNPGAVAAGLFLFALPWGYLWPKSYSKQTRIYATALFVLSAVVIAFFDYSWRLVRYLIPLFPVLSVLAALNIELIYQQFRRIPSKKPAMILIALLGCAYLFSTRLAFTVFEWQINERYPVAVALGIESPTKFLSKNLPSYDALQYINKRGDGQHKVLSIGNDVRMYTTSQIDTVFFSQNVVEMVSSAANATQIINELFSRGYDYLFMDTENIRKFPESYTFPWLNKDFLDRYTRLEFARNNIYVYRLQLEGTETNRIINPNLVTNGGFEDLTPEAIPANWETFQFDQENTPEVFAHSGAKSVQMNTPSTLYQAIDIEPDQLYTVGAWMRAEVATQFGRLQIMWLDQNKLPILTSIDVVPASQEWTWHQMSVTAPEDASFARVYINSHDNSEVWYDDVCFVQGDRCIP